MQYRQFTETTNQRNSRELRELRNKNLILDLIELRENAQFELLEIENDIRNYFRFRQI